MSMKKLAKGESIPWLIHEMLRDRESVTSGDVAREAGVTRQAAHYHLKRMAESGELESIGSGRGSHYINRTLWWARLETSGLEEDVIWKQVTEETPALMAMNQDARSVANYAFTEMLNNAIDHSGSSIVDVAVARPNHLFSFKIEDEGVGAFERVRKTKGLEDHVAAIQEISKGKLTTAPKGHSGQGIFFTSKAVDVFSLIANGLKWTVDNVRYDEAIGSSKRRIGTSVHLEIDPDTQRSMREVFDEYTDPETFAFSKSRATVRLFEYEVPFVSRSEAKRLARNLDQFEVVEVDFHNVADVGQGFADELFRVWQSAHPSTQLQPINMNPGVRAMIERALRDMPSDRRNE
jgi:anti-sigma regulatory factor (Ser/Thr protein kinase)